MTLGSEERAPDREALAWLGLAQARGLEAVVARRLVARFGTAAAVVGALPERLAAVGLSPELVEAVATAGARAAAEATRLARAGAHARVWSDLDYPAALRSLPDAPLALAVRGTLLPADEMAVAIVGARRASEYGRGMAEELARGLALAGLTVVSGLAAGIDGAAHRAALAAGGRTIAVLGTGVDVVYPTWHRELAENVARQGALVSELPCGAPALAYHFPKRNRLISGLSLGTIVVEAAERSGSLITAHTALEQGREVFAVPGPARGAGHRGPHRLIRQGATLVTSPEEVLEALAPALAGRLAAARAAAAQATLTASERRILDALEGGDRHVDEVIRRAALGPGAALEILLALELRGLVHQLPGKRFRRQAA
jgi:DNA processing protein